MTLSLSKLQECAEKATPGPWFHNKKGSHEDEIGDIEFEHKKLGRTAIGWVYWNNDDAQFIASFNPETAKALIRVVRLSKRANELGYITQELEEALKEIEL